MPVDPRLLAAQRRYAQLQAARAPAIQVSPVTRVRAEQAAQAQAKEAPPTNPFMQVYQARQAAGVAKGGGGGGGGGNFLANLGTEIVGGIGKVLAPLDYPRRFVLSGMKELADLAGDPGDRLFGNVTDEASWSDFMDQVNNKDFGFGDIVGDATGNEWLDRGIGLFGDIAADPLTYLTLGSTAAVGGANRLALGGEAVAKNALREGGEAGLRYGDEALARIAKYGEHALSPAERADLGLQKAGLRFGTHKNNVRIPGTGQISTALGKTLGAARGKFTDTAIGRGARRLGSSRVPATRAFTEAFATGGGVGREAAAATMRGLTERAGEQGLTIAKFARGLKKDLKDLDGNTELYHAIEAGADAPGKDKVTAFTKKLLGAQEEAGIDITERQRFMPRYNTPIMEELLGRGGTQADLIHPGLGSGSGRLNPRVFQPNSTVTIAGKEIHLGSATARDIQDKIWEAFPELAGKKLIEDDLGVVLPHLLKDAGYDIGKRKFEQSLEETGQLIDVNDPRVTTRGALDETATEAARKEEHDLLEQIIAPQQKRKDLMGTEVQRLVGEAVGTVQDQADAVLKRSKELVEQSKGELDKAGRGADFLRGELDRIATEGEQQMVQARTRLEALNQEADAIRTEARATRGRMNRQRSQGYRQRIEAIDTERKQLQRIIDNGAEAAKQQDVVRKRLGRALAGQTELAAQVGEGPAGAERLAAGQTLPQAAQAQYFDEAAAKAAEQGQTLELADQLKGLRQDPDAIRQLAEQQSGGPVGEAAELSRQKARLGGTPEGHARVVEEAMTGGLTKKGSRAATPTDRAAARRALTSEQLAEPNILSDAVTNVNDPDIVQAFYDTQQALTEALRPYRASNDVTGGYVNEAVAAISPEDQARHLDLTQRVSDLESRMRAAKQRIDAGIEPKQYERSLQSMNQERNKLLKERDALRTTALPRQIEKMSDEGVAALTDRAARLADYMVRYAEGIGKGGRPEEVAARATVETLKSERDEVAERLANRLPAERAEGRATEAQFKTPKELDDEVERRWDIEQRNRDAADDKVIEESIQRESSQKQVFEDERGKPVRAQERADEAQAAADEAKANAREARNKAERGRRKGMSPEAQASLKEGRTNAAKRARELQGVADQRAAEAKEAASEWRKFRRENMPTDVALPEQAAREGEAQFKARVRENLKNAKVEVTTRGTSRERASAFELHERIQQLAEPAREAARKLKRFQRLVENGKLNPGEMRDLLEEGDINALLERGNVSVNAIESQLKTRVFEEQKTFNDNMRALVGKDIRKGGGEMGRGKLAFSDFAKRTTGDTDRKMRDLLSQMSPKARGLWDNHLKQMSVLDNRRLRDLNERLTRMGETTAGASVTDKPYFALLEPPSALRDADTALPPKDLSQLVDPSVTENLSAQQAALETARTTRDVQLKAVEGELADRVPMEGAVNAQLGFEDRLKAIAAENAAQRGELGKRTADLSEFNTDLTGEVAAGRGARSELAARGTPDEDLASRLAGELAPHQERLEGLGQNLEQVQGAASLAEERLAALPEQVGNDLSATRSAYEAARGAQIEGAVQVAQTEQMVTQATDHLKKVRKYKTPKAVREGGDLTSAATDYENGVAQVRAAIESGAPPEVISLLDDAAKISSEMVKVDRSITTVDRMQEVLKTDKAFEVWETAVKPGFELFTSKTGGSSDQVINTQLRQALDNMENILFKERGGLGKVLDAYTRFFKSYATATPGFHLRNSMSAAFMNAADGVSVQNQIAGVRAFHAFVSNPEGKWWEGLPKRYRDVAQDAMRAVHASGAGGAFDIAEIGQRAAGKEGGRLKRAVTDNFWLKGSQRAGSRVEGSVRMGMAIDSLLGRGAVERASGTFSDAVGRINRIHFNYSQVGEWDEMARRVIPFWTFLSRNVPLQIQQMLIRPQTYLHYQSFVRNFESSPEDTAALPDWITQASGFALGGGKALMPDVGANQLAQSVNKLTNPSQLAAQLTPILKAPAQLMAGKNFFYDEPYKKDDYQELPPELRALTPLYKALGLSEDLAGGGQAVERKYMDAAYDILPPISWLNRLTGSTANDEDKTGKQQQALLNFIGIPLRNVTPEQLTNEQKRRRNATKNQRSDDQALRKALAKVASG